MNKKILIFFFALCLMQSKLFSQSTQSVQLVCGTSISVSGLHCDNSPIDIIGTALNGNSGYFDLVGGSGTLDDHGDKTATYYPVIGEGTVVIGFNNNQDDGCTPGQIYAEVTINLISVPATPSVITGNNLVCFWNTNLNYSVVNDPNTNNYNWTFPAGTVINSGAGNNSVNVSFGNNDGNVLVTASNACGVSAPSSLYVDYQGLPADPGPISGPPRICASNITAATYSISPLPNQIYTWTIPSGATIVGGGGATDNFVTLNLSNVTTGNLNVLSGNNCTSSMNSSSYAINTVLEIPEICMVTVDDSSKNNIIYWDKTSYAMTDTFFVYREVSNNNYQIIGKVPYDSISMCIDTVRAQYFPNTGDPKLSSYRYKLAIKDTCGGLSAMGPYHSTMFLQDQGNGNFNWTHYGIEGQPTPISAINTYLFLRDNDYNGVFETTIGATSSNLTTDPQYATYANIADWRIETDWTISCDPTLRLKSGKDELNTVVVKSKSNIKNTRTVGVKDAKNETSIIKVYPNPANELLNVEIGVNKEMTAILNIENMVGQVVYSQVLNQASTKINISSLEKGVYFIMIITNGRTERVKLLKL